MRSAFLISTVGQLIRDMHGGGGEPRTLAMSRLSLLALLALPMATGLLLRPCTGRYTTSTLGLRISRTSNPSLQEVATPSGKYGGDPREGKGVAPVPVAHTAGLVGRIESIGQLQTAIDTAGSAGSFVAVKFMRESCAACASTATLFEEAAAEYAEAQFYLVDYDQARAFCKACRLKFVPSAHIYQRGELDSALPLGKKAWPAFAERLGELRKELS